MLAWAHPTFLMSTKEKDPKEGVAEDDLYGVHHTSEHAVHMGGLFLLSLAVSAFAGCVLYGAAFFSTPTLT